VQTPGHLRGARAGAAYAAAALAFASAGVTLFWTLGGTLLLDTVGGAFEDLARRRTVGAVALGTAVVLLKAAAGALALWLVRSESRRLENRRLGRRLPLVAAGTASAVLVLWGGANVIAGGLVLAHVVTPSEPVDLHALRWHVLLWDMWFLVWGLALGLAAVRYRRGPG
jgi:hypothetical protein